MSTGVKRSAEAAARDPLLQRSLDVLREGQAPSGAFVASPAFGVYRYSWLRDGAFCAHALDLAGEKERAGAFHRWTAAAVEGQRERATRAIGEVRSGGEPAHEEMLPTRYTLDGNLEPPDDETWPNFQLDGYGMWLWSLGAHTAGAAQLDGLRPAVTLAADYLDACWQLPCYGPWEEFDDGRHAPTLAAIAAGLRAASRLLDDPRYDETADRIVARLLDEFVVDGRFKRCATDERLDGSLLWLAVPFGVVAPDDPRMQATVAAVRRDLVGPSGGVRRYRGDTYFGGGEWILLACSLAWHELVAGPGDGSDMRSWVREQALPNGDLPEQTITHPQDPEMVEPWVKLWGPVATPLLWSHAMFVIVEGTASAA
jgi:GH15 family glucan-1,4-alpha-glucosidase